MSSNVSRRMRTEQVDVLSPKSQALYNSYTLIIGVFEDLKTRGDINNVTEGFLIRGDTYGAYAIDNTTSLLESGLLVNKDILGTMIDHHCSFTDALVYDIFKFKQHVCMKPC